MTTAENCSWIVMLWCSVFTFDVYAWMSGSLLSVGCMYEGLMMANKKKCQAVKVCLEMLF